MKHWYLLITLTVVLGVCEANSTPPNIPSESSETSSSYYSFFFSGAGAIMGFILNPCFSPFGKHRRLGYSPACLILPAGFSAIGSTIGFFLDGLSSQVLIGSSLGALLGGASCLYILPPPPGDPSQMSQQERSNFMIPFLTCLTIASPLGYVVGGNIKDYERLWSYFETIATNLR